MKRVRKHADYEICIDLLNDEFLSPPTAGQQHLVLGRVLAEVADDLEHLDRLSKRFVPSSPRPAMPGGWSQSTSEYRASWLSIQGQQVMQRWEERYMQAMADAVAAPERDVLEVGFGMGISAEAIQQRRPRSHAIIEAHDGVRDQFEAWRGRYPERDIQLHLGRWQDVLDELGMFDGIFFDTYPMDEAEYARYVIQDITFANHFFDAAHRHLRPGGVFTYFSLEVDSVSRRHQRRLFELFDRVSLRVVRGLQPPADCNYWWSDSMVVIEATK